MKMIRSSPFQSPAAARSPAAPTPLPSLRLVDVACRRGERVLFSGLDLVVSPTDLLWLRGSNGRGKTSLLRLVTGLAEPMAGFVLWGDTPIRRSERFSRQLVYIAHGNALKDDLTVAESLAFFARIHARERREPAILAALARMGLSGRERTLVRTLSQGLRRRVALARLALEHTPALWVLDEPFEALDAASAEVLHDLLGAHRARGGMVLLTGHQMRIDAAAFAAGVRTLDLDAIARGAVGGGLSRPTTRVDDDAEWVRRRAGA